MNAGQAALVFGAIVVAPVLIILLIRLGNREGALVDRAAFVARWHYTRHFIGELVPFSLCIFVAVGLGWFAFSFWWLFSCAVMFWAPPWCS